VAPLRAGKRVPLAGAAAQVALLGFFTLTVALYAVPVLAIVLVVPADRLTGLTGFIDALAAVFVVYGPWEGLVGAVAALALLWIVVATVTTLAAFAVAGDDNSRYFSVALTLSISLPALATGWSALALARTRRSPAR
jgi:hypothetical protein